MHYQHIIWDYNGTLLNDVELCVEVINGVLRKRSLAEITVDEYKELFDFPVKDYYKRLGFDFISESFEIVGTEFIVEYDKRNKSKLLHPGAKELLKEINKSGLKQSVLSAREERPLIEELKCLGIFDEFENIIGLNDHYAGGKTENGFRLIEKINIPKKQILLIGDTKHDAEVANETGIDCILLSHGHHTKEKLQICGMNIYENYKDARKYILQ